MNVLLWWVLAASLAFIAIAFVIARLRGPNFGTLMTERMRRDAEDPVKHWAQCAFLIVTGDCDYAYLGAGEARRLLQRWWSIHSCKELLATLDELGAAERGDNAWDLLRFIVVARLAAGCEYIGEEATWELIDPVLARLQRCYRSWPELAQAYVIARRQWQEIAIDGSQDDAVMRRIVDNIAELRDTHWGATSYGLRLKNDS